MIILCTGTSNILIFKFSLSWNKETELRLQLKLVDSTWTLLVTLLFGITVQRFSKIKSLTNTNLGTLIEIICNLLAVLCWFDCQLFSLNIWIYHIMYGYLI